MIAVVSGLLCSEPVTSQRFQWKIPFIARIHKATTFDKRFVVFLLSCTFSRRRGILAT